MKLKSILILLLSALSLTAVAQRKVAVYVRGGEDGVNRALASELVTAFTQSDQYIAVERTESFLAELSKEVSYQQSGAVSDNDIARLGNQFGVQLVCVVQISKVFDEKLISARLINVETNGVEKSATTYSYLASKSELQNVSKDLWDKLFGEIKVVPKGYVDLGLTSGTLWQEKSSHTLLTYQDLVQTSNGLGADIPTRIQWQELLDECTWIKKSNGYEVRGRNGYSIFLVYNDSYTKTVGESGGGGNYGFVSFTCTMSVQVGKYWSSTPKTSTAQFKMHFDSDSSEPKTTDGQEKYEKAGYILTKSIKQ